MSIKEIALACLNQERDVAATELKAQDTKIQKLQEINSLKASYYGNRAVNIVEMIILRCGRRACPPTALPSTFLGTVPQFFLVLFLRLCSNLILEVVFQHDQIQSCQ